MQSRTSSEQPSPPQKHRLGKIFLSLAGGFALARLLRWVGTHDLETSSDDPHHGGETDAKSAGAEPVPGVGQGS